MTEVSNVNIKLLMLDGLDILQGFETCAFYEDIFSNELSGFIDIRETESIREYFEGLPNGIIGEETLTLVFASRTLAGSEHSTISVTFWVNQLSQFTNNTDRQQMYRLHLTSKYHRTNTSKRNRKIWEDTGSAIVEKLVSVQLGGSMNQIDTSKYTREYIFPNWTPYQCANFLSTVSLSAQFNDPRYLFYECRDGFNFVSLSYLMNKGPSHKLDVSFIVNGERGGDDELPNVQTYASRLLFDNALNEHTGMYGNTLITYDKINKKFEETTQTYSGSWGRFKHVGETKLTKRYPENPKNRFQFMSINREANPGIYTHTDQWVRELLNRAHQANNNTFVVTHSGYTDFKVGDVLEFNLMTNKDEGGPDKKLSGKYLITKIKHNIRKDDYTTVLEIAKDGYKS